MKLWFQKGLDGRLYPSNADAEEYLKRWKAGDDFEVEIKMKRNGKHHRKGMAALQFVFDNQAAYSNFESFLIAVKILTGYVDTHITPTGEVYRVPRSIDFASMDEMEFGRWKNDALSAVFEHFIPAMPKADQERVINQLIGYL